MSKNTHLSPVEKQRIRKLIEDGFSLSHIERVTKRSRSSIKRLRLGMAEGGLLAHVNGRAPFDGALEKADAWADENPPPCAYVRDVLEKPNGRELIERLKDFRKWHVAYEEGDLVPHELEWIGEFENEQYSLLLAPPGSGKSFTISVKRQTWKIAGGGFPAEYYDNPDNPLRNRLFALVAKSEKQAGKQFDGIEARLRYNKAIIRDFGRFYDPDRTWTKSQGNRTLTVAGREEWKGTGDPTLRVLSGTGAALGYRVDELVIDDLADLDSCATPEAVDKITDKFRAEISSRRQKGCKFSVIMARLPIPHCPSKFFESIVVNRDGVDVPLFKKKVYPAVIDHDAKKMLWPSDHPGFMDWNELMEQKAIAGERIWQTMYQQETLVEGLSFCERAHIFGAPEYPGYPGCLDLDRTIEVDEDGERIKPPPVLTEPDSDKRIPTVTTMSIDPSMKSKWGCFVMDIPILDDDTYYPVLRDLVHDQLTTADFYDLIRQWWSVYRFTHLVIEDNISTSYQTDTEFIDLCRARGIRVLAPFTNAQNKRHGEYGLQKIATDVELGRIRIPWGDHASRDRFQPLIDEMLTCDTSGAPFAKRGTNDCLLALWFPKWVLAGIQAVHRNNGYQPMHRPPTSANVAPMRLVS